MCDFILTRGKNKNLACKKGIVLNGKCKLHQIQLLQCNGLNKKTKERCKSRINQNEKFCYQHKFPFCKHLLTKGKNRGKRCPFLAKNEFSKDYCQRHFIMNSKLKPTNLNLANDPIFAGSKHLPEKIKKLIGESKPKVRSTNFAITCNLNKTYNPEHKKRNAKFRKWASFLFKKDKIGNIGLFKFVVDTRNTKDPSDIVACIVENKVNYQFEIGPIDHKLHLHASVRLRHTGHLKFDPTKIHALMAMIFGWKTYFNNKFIKDSVQAWETYVFKHNNKNQLNI